MDIADGVNWQSPVNYQHPLNRDLWGWWMVRPNLRGGSNFWELTNRNFSLIRSTTTAINTAWRLDARRGGWGSLFMDGSDDNVLFDTSKYTQADGGLGGASDYTIMVWVKTSGTTTYGMFGSWDGADDGFTFDLNRAAGLNADGQLFSIGRTTVSNDLWGYTTSDTGFNDGTWHHVAVTVDHSAQTLSFYVDGRNWPTTYVEQNIQATYNNHDRIGLLGAVNDQGTISEVLDGQWDDMRFHRRGLQQREVEQYYRLSQQGYPGLLNRVPAPALGFAGGGGGASQFRRGLARIRHGEVSSLHPVEAGAI